jgi:hypothetical protein
MENRKGLILSHLLIEHSITKSRLLAVLKALYTIHTTSNTTINTLKIEPDLAAKFADHSIERAKGRVNIYANYSQKFRNRYQKNLVRDANFGPQAAELFHRLSEFLGAMHKSPMATMFLAMLFSARSVTSIDVRCQLDDTLTMEGDIHYDLAKVLQSLLGYDHNLLRDESNTPHAPLLEAPDRALLAGLQDVFLSFRREQYAVKIRKKTLLRIAASLLFSLIPLHNEELGLVFLKMCSDNMDMARDIGVKRWNMAGTRSFCAERTKLVVGGRKAARGGSTG